MKTATRIGKAVDAANLAGWMIRFKDGRGQFMKGISKAGAMRTADALGAKVEYVRGFVMENGAYTELA